MRITNAMMAGKFLDNANSSLNRLSSYQSQVDSTKRISSLSDDPQAAIAALKARNKLSDLDVYRGNIQTATSYLNEAEYSASALNEILQSVYEGFITGTNGSKTQDELNIIADEMESLQAEMVSVGNSSVGTSFIFGGYNFAGVTDGVRNTPPFSVDGDSGHLIYNGIDLSMLSWAKEYEAVAGLMTGYGDTVASMAAAIETASSDVYARDTLCAAALTALDSLMTSGRAALAAAEEFGIDPGVEAYTHFSSFIDQLSGLRDALDNERSKGLAQETEDGSNAFSTAVAKDLLQSAAELISNSDPAPGVGLDYSMEDARAALQAAIDTGLAATGAEAALAQEAGKRGMLQIGPTHAVEYTFSGVDLFGQGEENIYFVLDKAISLLRGGNTGEMPGMITRIQDAQSRVLSFQTVIGASEKRMSLINSRYESSEANYREIRSNAVDVDMAEALTNFTTAKTVYSAALAAGAKIIQTSLLDFLR
ncbi:MAG: hypothetical protein GX585_02325 [Clostridiales bacterium]|nr:hypothetical protein [Clostridiales bacterium]